MSTDYRIYLNYDNDKQVYCLPVNPEKITINYKGEVTSATIDKFGEILHKGKRDAAVVSFDSFFPPKYQAGLCVCRSDQFKKPQTWDEWMLALQDFDKPCHFVITGSPLGINFYADVTSYRPYENGGDPGTIYYSLELKESRQPMVEKWFNKIIVSTPKPKAAKRAPAARPSNKKQPRTYTVKRGDCLWNIARKYYGNGSQYTKIYNANRNKIRNPNLIYPGQVFVIP